MGGSMLEASPGGRQVPLVCKKVGCRSTEQDPITHVYFHMRDVEHGPYYCKGCGKIFSVRMWVTRHLEKCSEADQAICDTRCAFRDEIKSLFEECFPDHFPDILEEDLLQAERPSNRIPVFPSLSLLIA